MEERRRSQHGHAIDEADAPFINLESEREMQAYNLMKEREFLQSPAFDPAFLHQIGMDVEFDTVGAKVICKHKGLIPDSTLRRASRFDLTIDKGDNSNTLVPTTMMRPDVTAKRYSRWTRELAEVDSKNSKELVEKENMQIDEVVEKLDARIDVKSCI